MSIDDRVIAISATFTAEALRPALEFWMKELGLGYEVRFAGYNQVFQELLDPGGLFAGNRYGVNVVLVRVDDWPEASAPYGILVTVVRQTTPVVRPDDVLSALRVVAGLAPSAATSATRLEQGRLDDGGGIADPLAQDSGGDRTPAGEPAVG